MELTSLSRIDTQSCAVYVADVAPEVKNHRVGVDLGGTKIEAIVLGPTGEITRRERVPTPAREGYDAIVEAIGQLVERVE
ncbi:MAG: ROK family protein, partial [Myxococcota bacterium]